MLNMLTSLHKDINICTFLCLHTDLCQKLQSL